MNVLYKGARLLKDMYNQLNPATLTGAIDILVIEHEDGTLSASPFHVRFGKLGVLRAKEKLVNIMINEEEVSLHMKLGDQGEAFFVAEADEEDLHPSLLTSPLPSRPSTPLPESPTENQSKFQTVIDDSIRRKRKRRRKRKSITSPVGLNNEQGVDQSNTDTEEENNQLGSLESAQINADDENDAVSQIPAGDHGEQMETIPYQLPCNVFSDSELTQDSHNANLDNTPFSDSEINERDSTTRGGGWDWGELPENDGVISNASSILLPKAETKLSIENEKAMPRTKTPPKTDASVESASQPDPQITEIHPPESPQKSREGSPSKSNKGASHPTEGLYLDEILDLDPPTAERYISSKAKETIETEVQGKGEENDMDNARSQTPEVSFAGSDAGVDSGTDCLVSDDVGEGTTDINISPVKMSLCGGKLEDGKLIVDKEKFDEKLLTYAEFTSDPVGITNNPDLVILLGDLYCDWATAGPIVLSLAVYKKPLSPETTELVVNTQIGKKLRATSGGRLSWLWRRSSQRESTDSVSDQATSAVPPVSPKTVLSKSYSASPSISPQKEISKQNDESSSCEDEISSVMQSQKEFRRAQTMQLLYPSSQGKSMKKTTRLTSEQLRFLNLKPGANEVEFRVTSQYQGTSRCFATIYLWKWNDRVVVSDIDGTITKSDVFGQILPVVGKDWTQVGVAQLYDNISKNGYKFIYLSSRAIGQAGMTKGYLNWINQQGVCLPAGPLFLSPTSLMRAFRAEVIEKTPEKFKIQCLQDIKSLFPLRVNPLVAGFGNKINDVRAYTTVGIPKNRIFTINHRGELKEEDMQTYTTSYSQFSEVVDKFFPALDSEPCRQFSSTTEYSAFNYWRTDVPAIED